MDLESNRTYTANGLNQYTNIVEGAGGFLPQFDDDGNQTLIKTATGVWQVSYNGENRPVLWECGSTNITMKFDRMGRRVEYVEMVSGVTNTHHRFVYDGYVCVQRLNAASSNAIDLVFGWDPSEPVATRPLILQKYGQYNLFYTHDGNKNVSELVFFQQANGIAAHYEYAPFGAVTSVSKSTPVTAYDFCEYNPFRFSSEYTDNLAQLVYYTFRHYDTCHGRFMRRDPAFTNSFKSHYLFLNNNNNYIDYCGLKTLYIGGATEGPRGYIKYMTKAVGADSGYEHCDNEKVCSEICSLCESNEPIILIGHSWGGDSAIDMVNDVSSKVSEDCKKCIFVITLDPVSHFDPDNFTSSPLADQSIEWVNVYPEANSMDAIVSIPVASWIIGGLVSGAGVIFQNNNWVAIGGGRWNHENSADYNIEMGNIDHMDVASMMELKFKHDKFGDVTLREYVEKIKKGGCRQ